MLCRHCNWAVTLLSLDARAGRNGLAMVAAAVITTTNPSAIDARFGSCELLLLLVSVVARQPQIFDGQRAMRRVSCGDDADQDAIDPGVAHGGFHRGLGDVEAILAVVGVEPEARGTSACTATGAI